jgi:PIN domain nuclease of toxin-antitoxin system
MGPDPRTLDLERLLEAVSPGLSSVETLTRDCNLVTSIRNVVYLSAASAWELAIKSALGKIAQALAERLPILTADATIDRYEIKVIRA